MLKGLAFALCGISLAAVPASAAALNRVGDTAFLTASASVDPVAYRGKTKHRRYATRARPRHLPLYRYGSYPARPTDDSIVGFTAPNRPDASGDSECMTQFGPTSNGFVRSATGWRRPCF
jgi:hypothetical protein